MSKLKGILVRRGEDGKQHREADYASVSGAIGALRNKWRVGEATNWHEYEVWDSAGERLRAWIDNNERFCVSDARGGYHGYRREQR